MLSRRAFLFAPAALALGSAARAEEPFYISPNDVYRVEYKFRRREMAYKTTEPPGTIVVEPSKRFLYFIQPGGRAIRYGIGVGSSFKKWSGSATIVRMAKWPTWTPTKEMLARHKPYEKYKDGMPGGSDNPLGARAMYLVDENGVDHQYRIQGTPAAFTIGQATTSGCFRMLNADVIELYGLVKIGTRVVVKPGPIGF